MKRVYKAELPFKLLSGDASSMPLVDQMQHVVNHATLHRGQVVGMIRQLGIAPPSDGFAVLSAARDTGTQSPTAAGASGRTVRFAGQKQLSCYATT